MSGWLAKICADLPEGNSTNFEHAKNLFPRRLSDDQYTQLVVNREVVYSLTTPNQANILCTQLEKFLAKNGKEYKLSELCLTDATACGGGFVINLLPKFKEVCAFEINPYNFEALVNNVNLYSEKNKHITLVNGDYNKLWSEYPTDIVIIDPPWGGIGYKNQNSIDLYLGDTPLVTVIQNLIPHAKVIIVKIPNNFNYQRLKDNLDSSLVMQCMYVNKKKFQYLYILAQG